MRPSRGCHLHPDHTGPVTVGVCDCASFVRVFLPCACVLLPCVVSHPDTQPRAATITAVERLVCQKLDRATFKRLMGPLEDVLRSNMEVRYCAVLYCAVLFCAVLFCAVLCCSVLFCAVLCCAVLCCSVRRCVVLCCAVLCGTVRRCVLLCWSLGCPCSVVLTLCRASLLGRCTPDTPTPSRRSPLRRRRRRRSTMTTTTTARARAEDA